MSVCPALKDINNQWCGIQALHAVGQYDLAESAKGHLQLYTDASNNTDIVESSSRNEKGTLNLNASNSTIVAVSPDMGESRSRGLKGYWHS